MSWWGIVALAVPIIGAIIYLLITKQMDLKALREEKRRLFQTLVVAVQKNPVELEEITRIKAEIEALSRESPAEKKRKVVERVKK